MNICRFLDRINRYCWEELSENPSAIHLLKKNQDKINWVGLSSNPSEGAMRLLEQNLNKIHWDWLSSNTSDRAMQLLEKNQDKINWNFLSNNPSEGALQLLEKNQDKINWLYLSQNTHIFTYDYQNMKLNFLIFKENLMKNRFHPRNISKFKDWGFNGFD